MLGMIMELLPFSFALFLAIIIPALVIARQEVAIEGPFGWSALTFTKRYPTKHWVSRLYRGITGKDKWATEYHIMSNAIWALIFMVPMVFVALISKMESLKLSQSFWGILSLGIASFIVLVVVEDYIWFLLHPYYGPERHNANYVPWFQNFKGGKPLTYWIALTLTFLIIGLASWFMRRSDILIIWLTTALLVTGFSFILVPLWSGKLERKPLALLWWKTTEVVAIIRSPYAVESEEPFTNANSYVIPKEVMQTLIDTGSAIPLQDALSKGRPY